MFHWWNRCVAWHCIVVDKVIHSGQAMLYKNQSKGKNPDAADKSNSYMSPFQATQKWCQRGMATLIPMLTLLTLNLQISLME